ncbi:flagellar motor protein MotB [bacterium]|nr:flagellar motor protein MotB [bacterium]
MANKKSKDEKCPKGAPLWMVTYGDMMSLLMVFFVLIVSFSTIEEIEKFRAAMGSFKGALMPWSSAPSGKSLIQKMDLVVADNEMLTAANQIEKAVAEQGMEEDVQIHNVGDGIRIIFEDPVLFDLGEAELKPLMYPILRKIVKVAIQSKIGEILIEGHTDIIPINTPRFPSNWDLSAARALAVLKFFQGEGFPPERLVAVGYGQYRPRVKLPENATITDRGVNRRVEMFLKKTLDESSRVSSSPVINESNKWD